MFATVKGLIEARFKHCWGSTTPVSWDNICVPGVDTWVRFTVGPVLSVAKTLGTPGHNTERYAGVAILCAFTRCDTGAFEAMKLLDQGADIFRNQELTKASIEALTGRQSQLDPKVRVMIDEFLVQPDAGVKADYYQANLQIRYRADKTF